MADLAAQIIDLDGLDPTYVAAAGGGDKIVAPDDRTFLHVKNGGGSSITVTVVTPRSRPGGLAIGDVSVAVPAGDDRFVGPFPADEFGNPADAGKAAVTYSGVTTVTVAVLKNPRPS